MKKYKIGGQFSGVGAFDQALIRLGIDYENVYQAEWDKFARQTYLHNYEKPLYYVEDVYDTDVEDITNKHGALDIMMFSPPCQAFSLAGKRKGEEDDRGVLFYNSHEFIQKNKPRYFIFENVKGLLSDDNGRTFQRWVDYLGGKSVNGNPVLFPHEESTPYHIYYKVLNAKNYGVPQNRERVFIIGIRDDADDNFSFPVEVELQKRLKDILEENVDEKYFLSDVKDKRLNEFVTVNNPKDLELIDTYNQVSNTEITHTITTRINASNNSFLRIKSATSKGYEIAKVGEDSINFEHPNSKTRRGRVGVGVSQTLTTSCNQGVAIIDDIYSNRDERIYTEFSPTIRSERQGLKVNNDYKIRKLTPRECFRLMDFPDTFDFSVVSDSQAYKQAGNSIVVNVLAQIINKLRLF